MKEKLQFILEGAAVQRYHARPGIKPDTDASHSFGVAIICSLLTADTPSANLLMAALTHDLAEQYACDMSAPAKRAIPGLGKQMNDLELKVLGRFGLNYQQYLTEEEQQVLKLADCFDGLLYCCRELALGNKNVLLIWRRFCKYIESMSDSLPLDLSLRASAVYEAVKEIYHETRTEGGPDFDVFKEE